MESDTVDTSDETTADASTAIDELAAAVTIGSKDAKFCPLGSGEPGCCVPTSEEAELSMLRSGETVA